MIYMIAANFRDAVNHAKAKGLTPKQWVYISNPESLRSASKVFSTYIQTPLAYRNDDYSEISEAIKSRGLPLWNGH